MWHACPAEIGPWVEFRSREVEFRERVISFLGGNEDSKSPEEEYCNTCKEFGEDDCTNCNRNIEVIDV